MPAVSKKQQRFFGAELGRAKKGKKTKTNMPVDKLRDFAMEVKTPDKQGRYK